MKLPVIIISLLLSLSGFSQQELPKANRIVLEYAKSKLGQKVGSGICFNLVDSALCKVNPDWKKKDYHGDIYPYGERVKLKELLPGDIFYEDRGGAPISHVSIVYKVNIDGSLVVLNQNVKDLSDKKWSIKKSKVVYLTYDLSGAKKWQLKFYRPIL
jgi:hypothetical protein